MKLTVAWIGKSKNAASQSLTDDYLQRLSRYAEVAGLVLKDEPALLAVGRRGHRSQPNPVLILLDSRGKQFSSQELAKFLGDHYDRNPAPLLFAIGPADGFSANTLESATLIWSLGKMTLAHEIARVVLLEQLYRAFTILKGHPYHLGH